MTASRKSQPRNTRHAAETDVRGEGYLLGLIEIGKDADLCVWSGDPLDIMPRVEVAYIDDRPVYRWDPKTGEGVLAPA